MGKRIFVLSNSKMPYGDANSNYIIHMCKALVSAGWEVISIGSCNGNRKGEGIYSEITYVNLKLEKKIIPLRVKGSIFYGRILDNELTRWNVKPQDYFLLYGGYISMYSMVSKKYGSFLLPGHIITCVVEWPMKSQYKCPIINPIYRLWHKIFYKWIPYWKKVIVISDNLKQHFMTCGCNTFYLPPLIDSKSADLHLMTDKNHKIVNFIYAGFFSKKDALESMLCALELLDMEDMNKIQFHITNNKEQIIKGVLGSKSYIVDKYSESLHIHGWLEYEDLLKLYEQADFLLLARPTNQYTLSNFPSKVPEMMNYGIVPVCSNVGDYTTRFLSDDVDSIIFEGCKPEDCAKAIRRAINKTYAQRMEMKRNAKENSRKMFDYMNWGVQLSNFIEEDI